MSGFLQALPFTLEMEGGFTTDTGGPTYQGVTQAVYDQWRLSAGQPKRPVREMTEEERDAVYYRNYWVGAKCDKLAWPLSMVHFDCAVNAGVKRAIKTLQLAVGATVDGVWGEETQERVGLESGDLTGLMDAMLWQRLEFYYVLASREQKVYGPFFLGWTRRVIRLRKRALDLW